MRKATRLLLAAGLFTAVSSGVMAADRAGFGVEWGIGPAIQLGDFGMKISQEFAVSWQVGPDVSVAVFGEQAPFHGDTTYTNDTTANSFDQGLQVDGVWTATGMRFMHALPFLKALQVGFELGVVGFVERNVNYVNSDGTTGNSGDFNGRDSLSNVSATLEGIGARLSVFKADAGVIATDLTVGGALRFVQLPDTYVFGYQETNTTKPVKDGIDPVTSYNHLAIQVALTAGF